MSRRDGEVVLSPAMARFVYGVIFEGREHIHEHGPQAAMLERFRKAGHGRPRAETPGQQSLIQTAVDEGARTGRSQVVTEYSSHEVGARYTEEANEEAAAEALALDNAAYAAAHSDRIVHVAGGVTGGSGGAATERYADPDVYADKEDMAKTARDRARQGHGVAAGTQ